MKFNKYIIGTFAAVSLLLSNVSCSDSYLDETLSTSLDTDYFSTPEGLEQLTISLYGNLRWHFGYEWSYGYTLYGCDEFTTGSDNTSEIWNTYDPALSPINYTKASGAPNNNCPKPDALWEEMYNGIATCNLILDRAELITDESVRKICMAHAYFLRGYNYYRLCAQYGAVALELKPIVGVVRNFERATEEQCWESIINDFRQAYNLFDGENPWVGGIGNGWTKATAAHFLGKALLFRASERNSNWNSAYINKDLNEAIEAFTYAIGARKYEDNYSSLFANWTGADCAIEMSNEILMSAAYNTDTNSKVKGRYGCRSVHYFHSQFAKGYCGDYITRGLATGGKDFQRLVPTEYTYAVYDHVNDARLWKTFRTVYGANKIPKKDAKINLGDPAIVCILNTKNDHTYDNYTFGAVERKPTFRDDNGRLPEWAKDKRQTPTSGELTSKKGQYVPASSILYQNGEFVMNNFGTVKNKRNNFYACVNKVTCGDLAKDEGDDGTRDITMARIGETYLLRAECYVRLHDYSKAMEDINVIRRRAAWKEGENRSYYIDGSEGAKASSLYNDSKNGPTQQARFENTNLYMNTYYLSNPDIEVTTASSADAMTLKSFPNNLPPEDEAVMQKLGVSGDYERALHFILNERSRELIGEWQRWETLSRTGTLIMRAKAFNPDAAPGITKGKHELRPIPQTFIDQLQNNDSSNLTNEQKAKWQNPGY